MNPFKKFFGKSDQNAVFQGSNVPNDITSTDESDDDSSIVDSVSSGNELVALEPLGQQSNIGNIRISTSNDVTIGNRIIYKGPITIQQQVVNQNRPDLQPTSSNVNRSANALRQPGELN